MDGAILLGCAENVKPSVMMTGPQYVQRER
jgi:hypothetical protein